MSTNEQLRDKLLETLDKVNQLIQQERTSGQIVKMAVDETARLAVLQEESSKIREEIKGLQTEKGSILERAKMEAVAIVKQAEAKDKESADHLANIKRLERIAEENRDQAETIRMTHQAALDEVVAQKEKIRAALVG